MILINIAFYTNGYELLKPTTPWWSLLFVFYLNYSCVLIRKVAAKAIMA